MSEPFTIKQRGLLIWLSIVGTSVAVLTLFAPIQGWVLGFGLLLFVSGSIATYVRSYPTFRVGGLPPNANRVEGWLSATGLVLFLVPFAVRGIRFILTTVAN